MSERPIEPWTSPRLLVLCYHAVSPDWPAAVAVEPSLLERQLRFLLRRGYRPSRLSDAVGAPRREKTLVVTFDDAFRSVVVEGLPILERLRVPATVFVPTDHVASGEPLTWGVLGEWVGTAHEAELRPASWDELRSLAASGWEIGSHTCTHPDLTRLADSEAEVELKRSRHDCETELQRPCASFSYPFGRAGARELGLCRAAGYRTGALLSERALEPLGSRDPCALPREGIYRGEGWTTFLAKTSLGVRQARASRVWNAFWSSRRTDSSA